MSHGGGDDSIEPDLTPLLDLVMQLLMFFIVSVRFVKEQVDQDVQLPESSSAQAVKKADPQSLFINQMSNHGARASRKLDDPKARERLKLAASIVKIQGVSMDPLEAKAYLTDLYNQAKKKADREATEQGKDGEGEVNTVIHFRADGDLELNELFKMMNFVKAAGYTKLKIRSFIKRKG